MIPANNGPAAIRLAGQILAGAGAAITITGAAINHASTGAAGFLILCLGCLAVWIAYRMDTAKRKPRR